jgi:hypothetical protein
MGLKGVAPVQIRTHAGDNAHATLVSSGDAFTEEVAAIEELPVTMELDL